MPVTSRHSFKTVLVYNCRMFDPSNPRISALIIDMDGVLWRGDQLLVDIPKTFGRIQKLGLKALLLTNNSTRDVQHFLNKFSGLGVELQPDQVLNSAEATAAVLKKRFPQGGAIFPVGESGLESALLRAGFSLNGTRPLAVVVGLDRGLTYEKLAAAALHIRDGVPFIGTNPDTTYPIPSGEVPGAGAILALLEAATGLAPEVIGKPAAGIFHQALNRLELEPHQALVIGDRLDTDITGAQAAGCPTAMVLSGVSSREAAQTWQPSIDRISPDLNALLDQLEAELA
jgi:4-nitrophenyl phosphatase